MELGMGNQDWKFELGIGVEEGVVRLDIGDWDSYFFFLFTFYFRHFTFDVLLFTVYDLHFMLYVFVLRLLFVFLAAIAAL